MPRLLRTALVGAALVACAPESDTELDLPVVDLRDEADREWEGDTLIVDTVCLDLSDLAGLTLHQACDVRMGGRAHVGEDRIAATVFDDADCERAAGFLPPAGEGGEVRLPHGGLGVVLRCAVLAEPR